MLHKAPIAIVSTLIFLGFVSLCEGATPPLVVAIYPTPPFVYVDSNTTFRGFSIDLWDQIALTMRLDYKYIVVGSISELLNAVIAKNGSTLANVSICSISITQARAAIIDFSQPILDSGLQIMTYRQTKIGDGNRTILIIQTLFSRLFWEILGVFFIFIIVFTHIFYLIEKRPKGAEAAVRASYMKGGFEDSMWWSSSILFTGGSDLMPMSMLGRLLTFVLIMASCVLVAILQAAITAQLTVSSLQQPSGIQSISDLVGLGVGVEKGSTGELFLSTFGGINIMSYNNTEDMLTAFSNHEVGLAAVFGDFPVFQYFVANEGANFAQIVGQVYQPQSYGIAFPSGSALRKEVDLAILNLHETNKYEMIDDNWFAAVNTEDAGDINVLDPDDTTIIVTWGLVGLSILFVVVLMSVRYYSSHKKRKQPKDTPLEPIDGWQALEKEISEIQDHMEELSNRLHKIKELALRKKKDGTYY